MKCWRDKMPNGQPIICGTFKDWNIFLKWDGENWCKKFCPKGLRGKESDTGSYLRAKTHPWMDSVFGVPLYRQKVMGRKVA